MVVSLVATALVFGPAGPARAAACTDVWTGTGTSGDPYLITSRADLVAIDTCLQAGNSAAGLVFRQWGDISLGTWTPIGSNYHAFNGTYDGDCYTLSNMTVTGTEKLGLFAETDGAAIKNLKLVNPTVTGPDESYGTVIGGDADNSTSLDTIIVTGGSVSQTDSSGTYIGGVIGSAASSTTLTKVAFSGTVTATGSDASGLVGSGSATISESSFTGTVTGESGALGLAYSAKSIADSYSQSTNTATNAGSFNGAAAGLVGSMFTGAKTITNSYAAATVSGSNTAPAGTISATSGGSATLTIPYSSGGMWNTMIPLPITATDGVGSVGTGTTAGTRTQSGMPPNYFYPLTGTGLRDGAVTNISYSGIQAGMVGNGDGVTFPTVSGSLGSFFDSSLAPSAATNYGVLSVNGTNFNTAAVTGVTPKPTLDMKTAATYAGWSTAIWDLPATPGAKYPTHKWVSAFASGCSSGNAAPPAPPAPAPPSGGGSSTPVVEPTPTPTPTPTATVAAAVALDPIPNQVNANIPAGGVPQGGSVFLVNGVPAAVSVAPNAQRDATALDISGPDFTMKLSGTGDDEDPLGLTARNALILQSKQTTTRSGIIEPRSGRLAKCVLRTPLAVSSGTGFKAGSPVRMYILPSTYIGELVADGAGSYSGSLPVPVGVRTGDQTLQANGFSPSGVVRSLSLGIQVKRGRVVTTKTERGNVFFEPLSTVISPVGEATLNALVRKARKQGVRTVVVGFVQETATTSNDDSLSTQRARNVASYLRDRGLKGAYAIRGDGVGGPGDAARRVNVSVTYQSGC